MSWVENWREWIAWPFDFYLGNGQSVPKPADPRFREMTREDRKRCLRNAAEWDKTRSRICYIRQKFADVGGAMTTEIVDRQYGDEIPPTLRLDDAVPQPDQAPSQEIG